MPTKGRYCDKHKPDTQERSNVQKDYQQTGQVKARRKRKPSGKDNKGKSLYGYKWQVASKAFKKAHPLCARCGGIFNTVVDHIRPHRRDKKLFWDRSNWQVLCQVCHGQKSSRERIHFKDVSYHHKTKG